MHPGRQLAVLGAIFVSARHLVWFGGDGGWRDRLEPNLGLDLIGGTTVTLQAKTDDGKPPPTEQMRDRPGEIIDSRVNGLGVSEAEVVIEGDTNIVISVPGKSDDAVQARSARPAELRFRKVLGSTADTGATGPSAPPSASAAHRRPRRRLRQPRRPPAPSRPRRRRAGGVGRAASSAAPSAAAPASAPPPRHPRRPTSRSCAPRCRRSSATPSWPPRPGDRAGRPGQPTRRRPSSTRRSRR